MTLASLHQVLTVRMSPSPPHPPLALRAPPAAAAPAPVRLCRGPAPSPRLSGWHEGTRGPAPAPWCVPPPPCTAPRRPRSRCMWHRRPVVQPHTAHELSRPCGVRPAGLGVRRITGRRWDRSAPRRGFPGGESAAGTSLAARSLCAARAGAAAGSRFSEVTGVCAGASRMGSMGAPLRGDSGHGGGAHAARVRLVACGFARAPSLLCGTWPSCFWHHCLGPVAVLSEPRCSRVPSATRLLEAGVTASSSWGGSGTRSHRTRILRPARPVSRRRVVVAGADAPARSHPL